MKVCPFCAEEIQDAAVVCRHCGRDVKTGAAASSAAPVVVKSQEGCFLQTMNAGCALIGILLLLVLGVCIFGSSTKLPVPPSVPAPATPTPSASGRPTSSRSSGNAAHDRLMALSESARRDMLAMIARSAGERCAVTRAFFQGQEPRSKAAMWNVQCREGSSYVIQVNADATGSTKVLNCSVLKVAGGVDCFTRF